MDKEDYNAEDTHLQPFLLRATGALAVLGCAVMVATTVAAAIVVEDKNWMADTISDLAAGRWEEIQDGGIYALVMAAAAAAAGSANLHPGRLAWSIGVLALVICVPCMTVIAAREAYSPTSPGTPIHIYVVSLMGLAMTAGPCLMAAGAARIWRGWQPIFWIAGLGFGALIPVFFFLVPTSLDGLVERMMGVLALTWIGGLGVLLWRSGDHVGKRQETGSSH